MDSTEEIFTATGLTARLFRAIEEMSEDQKRELLVLVGDQRKFTRKPYLMGVSYKTRETIHEDFILDISPGGTFIETNDDFFTGQEVSMTFNFKEEDKPFNINGCVVWQSNNGVGIKFIFETLDQQNRLEAIINRL